LQAFSMTGRSDVLPMIMLTNGFMLNEKLEMINEKLGMRNDK